jgi:hypothetical protein
LSTDSKYYERKGFTPYFFAHVVFNIVDQKFAFLRNLEDLFGDVYAANWCDAFPRHTNLHQFIYNIVDSILFEDPTGENDNPALFEFCKRYEIETSELDWDEEDSLHERGSGRIMTTQCYHYQMRSFTSFFTMLFFALTSIG